MLHICALHPRWHYSVVVKCLGSAVNPQQHLTHSYYLLSVGKLLDSSILLFLHLQNANSVTLLISAIFEVLKAECLVFNLVFIIHLDSVSPVFPFKVKWSIIKKNIFFRSASSISLFRSLFYVNNYLGGWLSGLL